MDKIKNVLICYENECNNNTLAEDNSLKLQYNYIIKTK